MTSNLNVDTRDLNGHSDLALRVKVSNDKGALKLLRHSYMPLMYKTAHYYLNLYKAVPLDINDLMQWLNYSFEDLIKSFDLKYKKSLASFLKEFMPYKLNSEIRKYISSNQKIMNYAKEINTNNELVSGSYEIEFSWEGELDNPQKLLLKELLSTDLPFLSTLERNIINSMKTHFSFEKTAKLLNISTRKVYSTFHRAKKKLTNKVKL